MSKRGNWTKAWTLLLALVLAFFVAGCGFFAAPAPPDRSQGVALVTAVCSDATVGVTVKAPDGTTMSSTYPNYEKMKACEAGLAALRSGQPLDSEFVKSLRAVLGPIERVATSTPAAILAGGWAGRQILKEAAGATTSIGSHNTAGGDVGTNTGIGNFQMSREANPVTSGDEITGSHNADNSNQGNPVDQSVGPVDNSQNWTDSHDQVDNSVSEPAPGPPAGGEGA